MSAILVQDYEEKRIENIKMKLKLKAAERVMREVDRLVDSHRLSSRSQLADARLDYSEPHNYEYTK